jgi:hypothetical protein
MDKQGRRLARISENFISRTPRSIENVEIRYSRLPDQHELRDPHPQQSSSASSSRTAENSILMEERVVRNTIPSVG